MVADTRPRRADGRLSRTAAKDALLDLVRNGWTARDAVAELGYVESTYEQWRRSDPIWAQRVSLTLRASRSAGRTGPTVLRPEMSFAEFSLKYLGAQVFPHMQNVIDVLERREPSWLHPAMTYVRGDSDLVIVNVPPEFAKTVTVSINYAVYATCMNPNLRGLVVSKTGQMSQKMLYAIKARLTEPGYADLIADFSPPGGFAEGSAKWTQDTIYLGPALRDSGEKDPTWQALGIGSQIYGARADLIILDDCIDSTNSTDFERQIEWIQSHVLSRLSPSGILLVIGTRLAPQDLYVELQREDLYPEGRSPWTYLAMPAVLEFADDPADWVTLWPKTNMRDVGNRKELPGPDGMYEKWSGPRLAAKRARVTPILWARVYQQAQVAPDTVFDPAAIRGVINKHRKPGLIPFGTTHCRPMGMGGLIVIGGLDPATSGHTAMVVLGLDPQTSQRYLLDITNEAGMNPDRLRMEMFRLTEELDVVEWVVEINGFQGFLAHDREINQFMSSRGALVRPHYTGGNKRDASFGVAAMSGLFNGWQDDTNLLELPSTVGSEPMKALIEQLSVWTPDLPKGAKTDTVMALWMAELGCQRRLDMARRWSSSHARSPFATSWDRENQMTVDLLDVETVAELVRPL